MADKIEFDFSELTRFGITLGKLHDKIKSEHIAAKLASDARNIIVQRTQKGLDVNLTPLPGYSTNPYYRHKSKRPAGKGGRRKHKKTGRPLKTIAYDGGYRQFAAATKRSGTTVTLTASNNMFRAFMAREESPEIARIGFEKANEAAKAIQLTSQKGKFVGINELEKRSLEKIGSALVKKAIRGLGIKT